MQTIFWDMRIISDQIPTLQPPYEASILTYDIQVITFINHLSLILFYIYIDIYRKIS